MNYCIFVGFKMAPLRWGSIRICLLGPNRQWRLIDKKILELFVNCTSFHELTKLEIAALAIDIRFLIPDFHPFLLVGDLPFNCTLTIWYSFNLLLNSQVQDIPVKLTKSVSAELNVLFITITQPLGQWHFKIFNFYRFNLKLKVIFPLGLLKVDH